MNRRTFLACLAIVLASAISAESRAHQRIVFTGLTVMTMTDQGNLDGHVVIVDGGHIASIMPARDFAPHAGDSIIKGQGGYLLPGLIDAHIHIDHPQDLQMMALYGVTSAVNMRGLPWHLRLREQIRTGTLFAPDFISSGDYLDGDPPDMLPMASVNGAEAAGAAVRRMHDAGFDFIKVYSELSREQYLAICREARQLGMAVVGHVVDAASLDDLLACPQKNIAHGEQLFKVLSSREDLEAIRPVLSALSQAGITLTANRRLYLEMGRQPTELVQLLDMPEAQLIHPATFQPWRPGINRYARRDGAWAGRVTKVYEDLGPIVKEAHGIDQDMLLAGSDMPVAGSYPGRSLVEEIEAMIDSGLDGMQALATATRNPAQFIRSVRPDYPEVGIIKPGARADLLLVNANPAERPEALLQPKGVMLRGQWWGPDDLKQQRELMAHKNRGMTEQVQALESAVFSRDLDKAWALFNEFRRDDPDAVLFAQYPFFFFGFSLLYGESGLTQDAEQARKAVLLYDMYRQSYPEVHSAQHVYGLALEASGDMDAAEAAQRRALEIWPDYPPAKEALVRLSSHSGSE